MTGFLTPTSVIEACRALDADEWGARLIAGGTALVLMMRQGLVSPSTLVSMQLIHQLRGIRLEGDRVVIGARGTHSEVSGSEIVGTHLPGLAQACRQVGNVRVRNVGTLGGNLAEADYASDPPSVLMALDAVCTVVGIEGTRDVAVADLATGFYTTSLEPNEIITEIKVPVHASRRQAYEKFVSRSSEDRPCVGVAAVAEYRGSAVTKLSVVVGAVASTPQKFDEITEVAVGRPLDGEGCHRIADAYADAIDPIDDIRGSAWYRRQVTSVIVRRALERVIA